jgi:hypothetical protein
VIHGVRYHENGEFSIWVFIAGQVRTLLVPSPSEPRVSCSRAQISVWKWSLKLAFPSSLSGYQYKQQREEEMFRGLYFL